MEDPIKKQIQPQQELKVELFFELLDQPEKIKNKSLISPMGHSIQVPKIAPDLLSKPHPVNFVGKQPIASSILVPPSMKQRQEPKIQSRTTVAIKQTQQEKGPPVQMNKNSYKPKQTTNQKSFHQTNKKTSIYSYYKDHQQQLSDNSYLTDEQYRRPMREPRESRQQSSHIDKRQYKQKIDKKKQYMSKNDNYLSRNNRNSGQYRRQSNRNQQNNNRSYTRDHTNNSNQYNYKENNRYQQQEERNQTNSRNLPYKNECEKYLKNYKRLSESQEQLGLQIKNLKRYFVSSQLMKSYDSKPTQISVLKSIDYPMIFFEYTYKRQKRYMQLKDVDKGTGKKIAEFYEIVKKIYDIHYFSIDIEFEEAFLQFAKVKANEIHLNLDLKRRNFSDDYESKNEKMFYYTWTQQSDAQFTFFDNAMKQINFGEQYIKEKKSKVEKKYFDAFQRFCKSTKTNEQTEVVRFGEEEVDGWHDQDNRDKLYVNVNSQLSKVEKRLYQLLDTDIRDLEDQMNDKSDEQFRLIQRKSPDNQKIDRLGEQIDKTARDLDNFEDTRYDIEKQLKKSDFKKAKPAQRLDYLKLALKGIIFAKKQLQSDLPILGMKQKIFDLLDRNNLIILEGETGSGKSTQLPQMLCEYYKLFENSKALPVLVTQPRKIATCSLAERVADQLQQKCGNFVDFVASAGKIHNSKAKIVFKLDRLVLDQIVESPTLNKYSCLVIDQAHERTISIDVILGLVKDLLSKRKDFKVIITSASMEIQLFEKYFNKKTLKVSGRMYPVNIKYLPCKQDDMVRKIQNAIDKELLTERNVLKDKYKGHILVFCADTSEIQALTQIFRNKLNHNVFMVIPLHGKLTPQDQKKAFSKTKEHKLIFASRIAQTAITIDGVKVVIDPGWDREMQYDQKTKFSSMKLIQISQSSAKQRAGRAGRTQEGFCLRLYSEQEFKNRRFNKLPEIKNIALETLILRLKVLGIQNVSSFNYIERPSEQGMKTSTEVLKMIGCLDDREKITTIGRFLVKIPIQPFLARAIIEGLLMQKALTMKQYKHLDKRHSKLIEPVIQILCMILSAGNLFRITENFRQLAEYAKYQKFSHEKGDFFFLKNVYDQFKMNMNRDKYKLNEWLNKSFLIRKTLVQVRDLVKEIKTIISQFRIDEWEMKMDIIKCKTKLQRYVNQEDRILSCLTTCFAANLCLYSGHPQIGYTFMSLQKIVTIYGTSCLSLLGICPKWILAYDFYENKDGKLFCKVANEVDYEFLRHTVDDYVLKKYQIDELRHKNPFYKQVNYKLETLVLLELKQFYESIQYRFERQPHFLKKLNVSFNDTENKMSVFIKCDQKQQKLKQQVENELDKYIQQIRKNAHTNYTHNYIGNIFVVIGNGFEIESILFKNTQTVYDISNLDEETCSTIRQDWSESAFIESFGKARMKIYLDSDDSMRYLEDYTEFLKYKNHKITVNKAIENVKKKIPQTKINLHWYAGRSQSRDILIQYGYLNHQQRNEDESQQFLIDLTQKQMGYIYQAYNKLRWGEQKDVIGHNGAKQSDLKQIYKKIQEIERIRLTYNRTGIKISSSTLDEMDLHKLFQKLIVTNKIDIQFQMPNMIKKSREAQRPDCTWKDSEWIQKIQQLLQQVTDKREPSIRVWGYGARKKQDEYQGQYERSFRIDMKAEIKTFDGNLLQKMKNKFDGKYDILGMQKLHVTSVFTQSVVGVDFKTFNNLKVEYEYNVQAFKAQYPGLTVDIVSRHVRQQDKKSKVYINISSQNRQQLLKPIRELNSLSTPKYITLGDSQYRYLNSSEGNNLLQDIQIEFDYKICFDLDNSLRRLKLYCHESQQSIIKNILKSQLSKVQYHDEMICYKGRNLKKIQQMLIKKKNQVYDYNYRNKEKLFLAYQIKFSLRKIKIMADINTFNNVKQQILQVKVEDNDRECPLCFQQMLTPYKFFNCGHSFCWFCLSSIIKDFKRGQNMQLKCPYMDKKDQLCDELINIYDIKKILSQQEMYQIFDIHISKFVNANHDKYQRCTSPDCEQIFDVDVINEEKVIDCQLCGKHYCLSCQASHKNYSCRQWKKMIIKQGESLNNSTKWCPYCRTEIRNPQDNRYITCNCGEHICGACFKGFPSRRQCEDHLVQMHK